MSRAGLAERWKLFVGAVGSVCLGVALVQSSLLLLISAATLDPPPGLSEAERMRFGQNVEASVAMLGVLLGSASFLAIFIISSTFAFTVAERRRDLALLRLVGGSRGQLRRLLLGEAVLLGLLGTALGVPTGLAAMALQAWQMRAMGFVPDGFHGEWRTWILGVSVGAGLLLAVAGVLLAARRAARIRPLEALRDTGEAGRVMTAGRWLAGLIFLAGAVTLILVSPHGGSGGGPAMAMNAPFLAAAALAAFAPLLVPLAARLTPILTSGPIGELARANLRDGRRRSASVAAPVIVLIGLVLGQTGAQASFTTAGVEQQRATIAADLVVTSTGAAAARIAATPGVAAASTEVQLPAKLTTGHGEDAETETESVLVVDPQAYSAAHPGSDALRSLTGRAVAAGPSGDYSAGGAIQVRLPGLDLGELPVTVSAPAAMNGGPALLLPAGLVPPDRLAEASAVTFVRTAPGTPRQEVSAALATLGTVTGVSQWLAADAAARADTGNKIMVVILGLGGLYALLGVVNSVVIGAAARRREFAEARVTGLSRAQVVRAALAESTAVTGAGVLLGLLAAASAYVAALATTSAVTGTATLDLPWALMAGLTVLTFLVTSATSVLTSWSATREAPVSLLGARE